jgi:imidazolonepropionase-like amidohydrolase
VLDGTGAALRPAAHILLEDGRIAAVADTPPAGAQAATIVEGEGLYALPGFIDTHVHLVGEGPDLREQLAQPMSLLALRVPERMRRTLFAGVTTVRDLGGLDGGFKQALAEHLVLGPRLQTAVAVMSITGGHGDFRTPPGAPLQMTAASGIGAVADGPEGVLRSVRALIQAGADVIKVATTGGVLSPADDPHHSHFSPDELAAIAAEAGRQGRRLAAHAQGTEGIKNAVRAGFTSIEHGIFLDDEAIDLMLERGTFLVPTLVAPMAVLEAVDAGLSVPPWAIEKAKMVIDAHSASVARAHAAGVRIAFGTDSGVGPHGQNLRELGLLQGVGLSAMEAIVAATRSAAAVMGLEAEIGTLEAGKRADVVLASANPLEHLGALADPANIAVVIQDGRIVKDLRSSAA